MNDNATNRVTCAVLGPVVHMRDLNCINPRPA